MIDIISYIHDNINNKSDKNLNLHTHVSLDKEAGKAIGQGLNTIGSQIGLGATIAGVSSAVAKGLVKSSLPPMQKAGVIISAGLIGGLSYSKITAINRNSISYENINNNSSTDCSNTNSNITKFMDDGMQSSPLQDLLLNLEATNYICISLIILLIIQIVFKFFIKNQVKLNLSNLFGVNINNKLQYYINKIISLNKKMSTLYI